MNRPSEKPIARRRRAALLLGAALVAGVSVYFLWPRSPALPPLPTHDDPAVVEAYATAKQQVFNEPRSAEAWGRLGMTLFANGDTAAAVPFLAEAERLDASDYRWPYLQAMLLLHGQPAAALEKGRRARELAPRYVNIHVVAGEIAFLQGLTAEAKAAFEYALEHDPDNSYAGIGRARCLVEEQHFEDSRKLLKGLLAQSAVAKAAHVLLAEVLDRIGQPDQAAAALARAQALPNDPPRGDRIMDEVEQYLAGFKALTKRTERLQKQGALSEAIDNQRKAVELYGKQVAAHFMLGRLYGQRARMQSEPALRQADLEAAQSALQTALNLDPGNMHVKFYLGLAFVEQRGDRVARGQAISHFRGVLARQPEDSSATEYLADCLMLDGAWKEAADTYRRLIQLRPDLPDAHAALAEALERQGESAAALTSWLHACQLPPANPRHQTRLLLAMRRMIN